MSRLHHPEVFMATAVKVEQPDDTEQVRREGREVRVGKRVILAMGEPDDRFQIQVRELRERRYRVTIYVGSDVVSARVAHSYFLETDDDGNIIKSVPKIKRRYERPAEPPSPVSAAEAVTGA
jgi:hypothetical protein